MSSLRKELLNDLVEQLHVKLLDNAQYVRLLDAVYNWEAVEGSILADDHRAAYMIRTLATDKFDEDCALVAGRPTTSWTVS